MTRSLCSVRLPKKSVLALIDHRKPPRLQRKRHLHHQREDVPCSERALALGASEERAEDCGDVRQDERGDEEVRGERVEGGKGAVAEVEVDLRKDSTPLADCTIGFVSCAA